MSERRYNPFDQVRCPRRAFLEGAAVAGLGLEIGSSLLSPGRVLAQPGRPYEASANWMAYSPKAISPGVILIYQPNHWADWIAKVTADIRGGPQPDLRGWLEYLANDLLAKGADPYSAGECDGEAAKIATRDLIFRPIGDEIVDPQGRRLGVASAQYIEYIRLAYTHKHAYDTPEYFDPNDQANLPLMMQAQAQGHRVIYNAPDSRFGWFFMSGEETDGVTYVSGWRAGQWIKRSPNSLGAAWIPHHFSRPDDIPPELHTVALQYYERRRPPADVWDERVIDFLAKGPEAFPS